MHNHIFDHVWLAESKFSIISVASVFVDTIWPEYLHAYFWNFLFIFNIAYFWN